MQTEILSRIQFAFTIGFHIIWPILTMGLILFLVIVEALWLKTKNLAYLQLYRFWVKIFALAFGIGVVTGIPLSYEFGTNFSLFSKAAGPVLGPLVGVEVMTAFFLEAAFIGVMLFGWKRVSPRVHFLATLLVALGTHNSAFWILCANSWMQTPQGVTWTGSVWMVESWKAVIFNPSMPYRFVHMVLATYISGALVVTGVSAWYWLKGFRQEMVKKALTVCLTLLTLFVPLQWLAGDLHGLNVLKHQPVKVAAMEGLWHTQKGAPLVLWGLVDTKTQSNRFTVEIPKLSSLILTHTWEGEVKGLTAFPVDQRPPVSPVFYSFRIMVGLGAVFLLLVIWGEWLRFRKRLWDSRWFLRFCCLCAPLGFVASLAGWVVAEVGRQPWVVYGAMRTRDAVSQLPPMQVLVSLLSFVVVYSCMLFAFLVYTRKLILKGPGEDETLPAWLEVVTHTAHLTPKR